MNWNCNARHCLLIQTFPSHCLTKGDSESNPTQANSVIQARQEVPFSKPQKPSQGPKPRFNASEHKRKGRLLGQKTHCPTEARRRVFHLLLASFLSMLAGQEVDAGNRPAGRQEKNGAAADPARPARTPGSGTDHWPHPPTGWPREPPPATPGTPRRRITGDGGRPPHDRDGGPRGATTQKGAFNGTRSPMRVFATVSCATEPPAIPQCRHAHWPPGKPRWRVTVDCGRVTTRQGRWARGARKRGV